MPITDIVLRGITRAVSDINTPDGGTAELINAVVENGEIHPAPLAFDPNIEFKFSGKLLGVHSQDAGQEVFITEVLEDDGVYLHFDRHNKEENTLESVGNAALPRGVKGSGSVATLGNVVVYSCPQGTYYFLYKDGGYVALGDRPPFPKLQFSLTSYSPYISSEETLSVEFTEDVYMRSESHRLINTTVQAKVEKFLAEARRRGEFVFPFFVRYALRMSDGSHILQSAPILMNPSTDKIPFSVRVTTSAIVQDGAFKSATTKLRLAGYSCPLSYISIGSAWELQQLTAWEDIVTHIDVFVSAPIYSYKGITPTYKSSGGDTVDYPTLHQAIEGQDYGYIALRGGLFEAKSALGTTGYTREWILPSYSQQEQYDMVKETSSFYLIHSIPIDSLAGAANPQWKDISLEEGTLDALVNRTRLEDDFNSFVGKFGQSFEVYNQRLILGNMRLSAYEGYPLSTMRPMVYSKGNMITSGSKSATVIQKGPAQIVVESEGENFPSSSLFGVAGNIYGFYYYPDPDAREMYVPRLTEREAIIPVKVQLTPHSALNGAYYFAGYPSPTQTQPSSYTWPRISVDKWYSSVSEVYQSQVGNPFYFPLEGITAIGNTPLISIIASSIEVSTGQVGDFPMYAFTGDGIWALSINNEGWISTPQLISNEVCFGRASVVALNRPLIFASNRGVMLLEGSKITSLSDALLGPRMDISQIKTDIDTPVYANYLNTIDLSESKESLVDFLSGAFESDGQPGAFIYDYPNHRVLIYHPNKTYAYVITLSNFEFSKMTLPVCISATVAHYSGMYVQDGQWVVRKLLKDVGVYDTETRGPVIAITRPMKFGEMSLKTVKRMLIRHNCRGYVKSILYGSRDGDKYYRLTSLWGRPYKYYVLALFASMSPRDRITSISIDWERRFANKLR